MKPTLDKLVLLVMLLMLVSPSARADEDWGDYSLFTITPYLGTTIWSDDIGLEDDLIYGGRAAIIFVPWLGVEGTYGYTKTERSLDAAETKVHHTGLDLFFNLMPRARINPYLTGGWAQLNTKGDWLGNGEAKLNGWEAGAGLKIRLGGDNVNRRDLRLEIRDVMTDLQAGFGNGGDSTHNLIVTAGLQFGFGRGSKDTDLDGVRDRADLCPDTPTGAIVDASGCPSDSDGDGVLDGIDRCPDTPAGATIDGSGCPSDSDGDGILDGLDRCPDTLAGATIDDAGCPSDSDGDGILDGIDQCPDTPSHLQVDASGCPIAITATETELLDTGMIRTSMVTFESGSDVLKVQSFDELDNIGETLMHWPELRVEIGGHTDAQGSESLNQELSERRAQAVLDYLNAHFPDINSDQYTVVGYGESLPVADNATAEGRARNRRVEFKVLNAETIKRVIESQKLLER